MMKETLRPYYVKPIRYMVQLRARLMGVKTRYDLINFLIKKHQFKSYMEIGVQDGICLKHIQCPVKFGVDPNPKVDHIAGATLVKKTSDDFFKTNTGKFDIIFIDGLHTHEQSYQDFLNAIHFLNPGGRILFHDCSPQSEEHARSFNEGGRWNGDVFKTILKINSTGKYTVQTVDIDHGCGIVELKPSNQAFDYEPTYSWFEKNRIGAINLVSWDQFTQGS